MDTISALLEPPPPPHLTTSVNQLRRFSTALSAFITRYEDFHTHLTFINSYIDSKLPHHLVETTNPNLPSLSKLRLLETSFCDQTITDLPEVSLLDQNPRESGSDFLHSYEGIEASNKLEVVDVSKNDVSESPVDDQTITDVTEAVVSEQNPNGMATDCDQGHENVILIVSESREQINVPKKPGQVDKESFGLKNQEEIDVLKNIEGADALEKCAGTDTLEKQEEIVVGVLGDQTITGVTEAVVSEQNPSGMVANCERSHGNVIRIVSESLEQFNVSKKPEQVDNCENPEETFGLKNREEIDVLKNIEGTNALEKYAGTETLKKQEETVVEILGDQTITGVTEAVVSEQNPSGMAASCERSHENVIRIVSEILEQINVWKKPEQVDNCENPGETFGLKNREEIDVLKNIEGTVALEKYAGTETLEKQEETVVEILGEQTITGVTEAVVSEQNPIGMAASCEQSHDNVILIVSKKPEQDNCKSSEVIDTLINLEEPGTLKTQEVIDVPKKVEEIDTWKEHEVTVSETWCDDQIITDVVEAVVTEQNPNGMAANCELSVEEINVLNKHEKREILKKRVNEWKLIQKRENLKKRVNEWKLIQKRKSLENTIQQEAKPACFSDITQSLENVTSPESLEEINVSNKPEENNILQKPEQADISKNLEEITVLKKPRKKTNAKENETLKKSEVSVLQSLCQNMSAQKLQRHVATHFSEMIDLREEIAKALKLAPDPAKLVLRSVGRFFEQGPRAAFGKRHQHHNYVCRMAAVLILECFAMVSSDGIEIAKSDQESAAQAAEDWRNRMNKEGGFGHTDEVDARGLLLLISGFGFQEHFFTIQDFMDLMRASNWKGISTALCRSAHLIPKIPWVICLMVKNNLVIEAVDLAYTFELEAVCNPQEILTTYLKNKIEEFQSSPSAKMPEAVEQHLFLLKSVKQCLESHNVDPLVLLPGVKINEGIQNLEKEVYEWKLIQKRKSLEGPIHQKPMTKHAETDTSKNPEETVPETAYDETITAVLEAIVSEQNPNKMAANHVQSHENVRAPESLDELDVSKTPKQTDILNKHEQADICENTEELDTLKKPEETVPVTSFDQTRPAVPEAIVTVQNPNRMDANHEQSHENVSKKSTLIDISKKPEQTGICKNPEEPVVVKKSEEIDTLMNEEEIDTMKKHEETEASKKSVITELESLCQSMSSNKMKLHVAAHFSEMINHRKEIATALKLAEDPAKLVLNSIGAFYVQDSRTFCQNKENIVYLYRKAVILILECFVMISSDGIEITKEDREGAAESAFGWRKRMIREGGLGHTDEVDARGLLLLISGFGIQDHVFRIQDIMDLIRASNVKEISAALRRSVFLVPKIPEVIDLMVKNHLEIEAADIAYTFGLEDKCHPLHILASFLRNHIRNFQNGSFLLMLEEMKRQLFDLKAVKQCLESHNIDPSTHLPDFKINEKIQNLEKQLNEAKLIQKRKSLDNPIHQEAKRACFGHENMPRHQSPVDHYGIDRCYRSTQLSPGYFDSDRSLYSSYSPNYSPSYVLYNAPVMPENITGSSPNGPAGVFRGSCDQMVRTPYAQHYSGHGQVYDSQPYGRGRLWGLDPPEHFPGFLPSGGSPRRRAPSSDLYGFADIVEREERGLHGYR